MRPRLGASVWTRCPLLVGGVGADCPDLLADVCHAADVGVTDDVNEPEMAADGGHLDQRLHVDVAVLHQASAPVAVGVHLGVEGGRPGERRDDEGRE
jgi:hypothetical protein